MKLKNIMKDTRALRDNGQFIEVGPGETIEVNRPVFNDKVFKIIDVQKSKEKEDSKTLSDEKEELNIKEVKKNGTS